MRSTAIWIATLTTAIITLAGCDPVAAGKDDTLAFSFATDDRLLPVSFGTPLALGLDVQINVFAGEDDKTPVTVSSAGASPPSVAEVVGRDGHRVTLRGHGEGRAEVVVAAGDSSDRFDLDVAPIGTVDLNYPGILIVPESPPIRIVEGGTARFMMTLRDAEGGTLIGYGVPPIEISPDESASRVESADVAHAPILFEQTGAVTITGQGDAPLDVTVVALDTLTGLAFEGAQSVALDTTVPFAVRGRDDAGETLLGLEGLVTVTTTTPERCTITAAPRLGDAAYQVRGDALGTCTIEATVDGLTSTEDVEVTEP